MASISTRLMSLHRGMRRKWLSNKSTLQLQGYTTRHKDGIEEAFVILNATAGRHEVGEKIILPIHEIDDPDILALLSNDSIIEMNRRFFQNTGRHLDSDKIAASKGMIPFELLALALFHFSALLSANITAVKVATLFGLPAVTFGTYIIPLVYLADDIITQVYGFIQIRRIILYSLFANFLVFGLIRICTWTVKGSSPEIDQAMQLTFGTGFSILLASTCSYLAGGFLNAKLISIFKKTLSRSPIFLRYFIATSSSIILDTCAFVLVLGILSTDVSALGGISFIITTIIGQIGIKLMAALLLLPIASLVTRMLKDFRGAKGDLIDIEQYG